MLPTQPAPARAAGIILAAGAAARMRQPKLLLPWKGEALIRHAARTALQAGLDPVLVVTGAQAEALQQALDGLAVQFAHNPDWAAGQSTSVRTGILALPDGIPAALFLLGDQPFVPPELIRALLEHYHASHPLILAPFVGEKRANPVLFDRAIFPAMCALQGDAGARSLFAQYPPARLPWDDERLLFDVDTPEDYQQLTQA